MFLRANKRFKDGKQHRYWSVVENRRVAGGRSVQKALLYLGEINDSGHAASTRDIEAVDERNCTRQIHLFPEDRTPDPQLGHPSVQLRLAQIKLARPRQWGGCWLALELWNRLELDAFWQPRLPDSRKGTPWLKVLKTLVACLKAFGYSRDKRPDCMQIVIALIILPTFCPSATKSCTAIAGGMKNQLVRLSPLRSGSSNKTTLDDMLEKITTRDGKKQRTWIMDRGIPTEKPLDQRSEPKIPPNGESRGRQPLNEEIEKCCPSSVYFNEARKARRSRISDLERMWPMGGMVETPGGMIAMSWVG